MREAGWEEGVREWPRRWWWNKGVERGRGKKKQIKETRERRSKGGGRRTKQTKRTRSKQRRR